MFESVTELGESVMRGGRHNERVARPNESWANVSEEFGVKYRTFEQEKGLDDVAANQLHYTNQFCEESVNIV